MIRPCNCKAFYFMKQKHIKWPGSVAKAKEEQKRLASLVSLAKFEGSIQYIAGIDVAFPEKGSKTRAAVVLLSFPQLELIEQVTFEEPTLLPYIPGVLSFREGNAILKALNKLTLQPDILMFDGQGVAHPLGLGIASHIGVLLNKPSIGIAKSCLCGSFKEPQNDKGSAEQLIINGECSGFVLRSRKNVKPILVSPGHLITKKQALTLALECVTRVRLPEPTRLADKLSKNQM